jgi:hypothetical protein
MWMELHSRRRHTEKDTAFAEGTDPGNSGVEESSRCIQAVGILGVDRREPPMKGRMPAGSHPGSLRGLLRGRRRWKAMKERSWVLGSGVLGPWEVGFVYHRRE